jgi:hypothetical protein
MLLAPIVLPKPCLSEPLDPQDFEVVTRGHPPGISSLVLPTQSGLDRDRERPVSFDPARAPWRRNRGSVRM